MTKAKATSRSTIRQGSRRAGRGPAVLAWGLWALFLAGTGLVTWLDQLLRQAGRSDLAFWRAEGDLYALLGMVATATVGAVVASRRPRHPVGWLLLAVALLTITAFVARGAAAYGLLARPGALPATDVAVVLVYALSANGTPVPLLALALLLTPTGSLPSPRWRWVARALVAVAVANALGTPVEPRALDPPLQAIASPLAIDLPASGSLLRLLYDLTSALIGAVFVVAIVAAAGSLVVRFRRARGVERQQLRWVALAAALVPVAALVALAAVLLAGPAATPVVNFAAGTVNWLVPLALGAAVLRYRLYDLDRIISRTLAWGLLTALLGGGYALVVLGLGQLVGQDSPLVVAAATLAVAAAFQPARRRIQAAVDRRFNRRRHDAARIIEAFGARLRDQVDLDQLTAEVLEVVNQTMQPTRASLWLRLPVPSSTTAGTTPGW